MSKIDCPDDETIAAFASAQLPRLRRAQIQEHLDSCPSCHDVLRELAQLDAVALGSGSSSGDPALSETVSAGNTPGGNVARALAGPPLAPGVRLDGYVLRRRVDAGAMGEVWVGDDVELGRQVAVKVLRGGATGLEGVLRNEARSLAQLSHPNVVTVHRVATWEGRDYIAMEYVAGVNLREWLAGKHTLGERVGAMIQAGRGLAAAHAAGIVHRDFKPSNVLMGADGRVRVGDFGLARVGRAGEVGGVDAGGSVSTVAAGTPAYMAPEQLRGGAATFAGDQYSLAVSLHEAVYGERPFMGDTAPGLASAIERGAPRLGPGRAPGWLRAIIVRGLAAEPGKRFASVAALVDALEAGRRRRRRALLVAAMVGVGGAAAAVALVLGGGATAASGCGGEEAALARVWSPARASALRAQFEQIAGPWGIEQWMHAQPLFDAYGAKWVAMRRDTCEATRVRHQQSDSLFDRRMHCLDRRLAQLDSVVGALATLSRDQVPHVAEAAGALPPLAACADTRWLSDEPLPPPAQRAAIDATYAQLDAVRALDVQGKYKDALDAAKQLGPRVEGLGYAPLVADLAMETGDLADRVGEFDLADKSWMHASSLAADLHRTDMVFEAQAHKMHSEAQQQKLDRALGGADTLESLARLSSNPADRASAHETIATIYDKQGKYDQAAEEYRTALTLLPEDELGGMREAASRRGLGLMLMDKGDYPGAEKELMRALQIAQKVFGEHHPRVGQVLGNLGVLEYMRGGYEKSLDYWQRALDIQLPVAGGEDPDSAKLVGNIALAQEALMQSDAAIASLTKAIELRKKAFGPKHPEVALAEANKALFLAQGAGRFDEAEALVKDAIAIRLESQGPEHPDLVRTYANAAEILIWKGESCEDPAVARAAFEEAIDPIDKAINLGVKTLGEKNPQVAYDLMDRARVWLGLGKFEAARADAQRSWDITKDQLAEGTDERFGISWTLGAALVGLGKNAEAATLLDAAGKIKHFESIEQLLAAFYLAEAWWSLGKRKEASLLMTRSVEELETAPDHIAKQFARTGRAWLKERKP